MKIYVSWPGKHKSLIVFSEVAGINRSNFVKPKQIVDGKEKKSNHRESNGLSTWWSANAQSEMKKEEDKFTRTLLGYFFEYDNGYEKKLSTNEMGLSIFVSHVSVLGFEVWTS